MNKKYGASGEKTIIRETGEEHTIVKSYGTFTIGIDIKSYQIKEKEIINMESDISEKADGWYYILDNGEEFKENEIIIGVDNIRDYKINQITK